MERAIRTWQGQLRTLRSCFEHRLGQKLPGGHVLLEWLVLWAADILNRTRVHAIGRTRYEMVTAHKWANKMAFIGEVIYFKLATDKTNRH